ncbi:orotidine-5'-phosphate decarboxylase [Latilactobacillus fuchuensis]|uniref:Orotidine 5'-phosphate decarboxylase n=2 Tax=Latilactobacillus fuchuensis TaxID=164393 RepID=A0A2N9DVF7_9LACO|nr:orotidine-5'-phosphate decarboxylase [Latilactobacillus fuchuensis]KRL62065.1 orotidine 5-phosphate decarboxylase [Latilactobacillus fuchuensis DSM 14340 = JCM 11249]SPC38497.1 orotidine 5'-phosphate decarboxylase [Latilactobacillus fuchuensis]
MTKPLIIALDFPDWPTAEAFLDQFPKGEHLFVKVGMELFYKTGPDVIRALKARGHRIFLDLKLHDIPNTVHSALTVIGQLGVDYTTIHAAGGSEMLQAGVAGLKAGATKAQVKPAKLLAITQLTSTSQSQMQTEQLVQATLPESVTNYAQIAQQAGCDGVVCSVQEVPLIHAQTGIDFDCVTPGIRPATSQTNDQKRSATPLAAAQAGSSAIVIGRPITQATNPYQAYQTIKAEWEQK